MANPALVERTLLEQSVVYTSRMIGVLVTAAAASSALAQPDSDDDFQWSTVGAVGNAAYADSNPDYAHQVINGRGSVGYEFRISTLETTTAQWMEFLNAYGGPSGSPNQFWDATPTWWNAWPVGAERYGFRTDVENAPMSPVFGASWRMSAMYCNWLHNGKGSSPDSLLTGAYDVSSWGRLPDGNLTDGATHSAGALFWIPTFDEQLKAFQYDPNRYGTDQGGWWLARNKRDTLGVSGPPGMGDTSAGYTVPDAPGAELNIPLGAYADSLSPWGLWDTSGGTSEWNEEFFPGYSPPFGTFAYERGWMGAEAGEGSARSALDMIWGIGSGNVQLATFHGLRIASSLPAPSCTMVFALSVQFASKLHRRRLL